jgi:Spy/CpxP family protein refolding chaperone
MMIRMKNELELSKTQYEQLLPKIEASERALVSALRSRREIDQRIRRLLAQSAPSESDLLQIVEKRIALEQAEHRREQALVEDVLGILTPRQQAQYVLFRQRFRAWLEQRLRDIREGLAGRGRPGARAGQGRPGSAERDVDAEGAAEDEWDVTPAEPRPDRMPEDRPPK